MRKKYIILGLSLLLILLNATIVYGYWAQKILSSSTVAQNQISIGVWTDGVLISDEEELVEFLSGNADSNGDYVLVSDIDLSDESNNTFEPIDSFSGTFDGQGHTITGFDIIDDSSTDNFTGIFNENTGTISNVIIENVNVTQNGDDNVSNTTEQSYVGILVGENQGTVENVEVSDITISSYNDSTTSWFGDASLDVFAGGIVGYNGANGIVKNSYSHADVYMETDLEPSFLGMTTAQTYAGGLVGYNEGVISTSYATGDVTSIVYDNSSRWSSANASNYAGGLVGYNSVTGIVYDVFATGNILINSDQNEYIGYVVGYNAGQTNSLYRLNTQSYSPTNATLFNQTTATSISNLQSKSYLSSNLNFDFTQIWLEIPNDYPKLQ